MKKKDLLRFKKLYEEQRDEIIHKLKSVDNELDTDGDDIDKIQGNIISALCDKLSKRDMLRLEKINSALEKIEKKTFGKCESCGEPIGEKRLEIIPGVELCIKCAEEEERDARVYACR